MEIGGQKIIYLVREYHYSRIIQKIDNILDPKLKKYHKMMLVDATLRIALATYSILTVGLPGLLVIKIRVLKYPRIIKKPIIFSKV